MKKLMIAAAIVCAAAMSQAAVWNWSASSGYLCDAKGQQTSDYRIKTGATAYIFDAATISQAQLIAALQNNTYSDLADAYSKVGVSAAPVGTVNSSGRFDQSADFEYGDTSSTYNFYLAAIAPTRVANSVFVSDSVSIEATAMESASTIAIASLSNPSKAAVKTGAYTEAGWYQTAAVPEPTSGLLLLLGVAGLALKRRRA